MNRHLGIVLGAVAFFYMAAALFLYFGQRELLYFPTPAENIKGFDALIIENGEHPVSVWSAQRQQARYDRNALIYFGGNAESLLYTATLLNSLFPEKSIYLPNYRGYGGRTGDPSEAALYEDALAVYDWVKQRHSTVSVIGRSLGSGVATYLASEREPRQLVLVTPFDSIENMARDTFYIFPVSWLLKDKFDSLARADAIHAPTLLIMAEQDEVIPRAHSERLHQALAPQKTDAVTVDGATHNDIATHKEYAMALLIFLESQALPVQ